MLTAQEWAEKWANRMQSAGPAMEKGAMRVTESPGARANRQKEKYRQRVLQSLDDGTTEAGNSSYTLQDWQNAYKTKAVSRASSGAAQAKPKVVRYAEVAGPIAQASSDECAGMPNNNDAEALAIVARNMANMKRIKQAYRGRR